MNAPESLRDDIALAVTPRKALKVLEKVSGKIRSYEFARKQRERSQAKRLIKKTNISRPKKPKAVKDIIVIPKSNKKFEDFLQEEQSNFHYEDVDKSGKPIIYIQ